MTHFVAADVGSARSDASDSVIVIAAASVAVVEWIIIRPFLFAVRVFSVTSKNLSDTKMSELHASNIIIIVFIRQSNTIT